jgi:uncharacterized protein (DUF302 family)
MAEKPRYGMGVTVRLPHAAAIERMKEELAKEGFGILTEIDVAATLRTKLEVEFRPYVILGACNPRLAHRALEAELEIGLLLPCNVIVYAGDSEGTSVIAVMDPRIALQFVSDPRIESVAEEAGARLMAALGQVSASVS